jgi:hypothetical protein
MGARGVKTEVVTAAQVYDPFAFAKPPVHVAKLANPTRGSAFSAAEERTALMRAALTVARLGDKDPQPVDSAFAAAGGGLPPPPPRTATTVSSFMASDDEALSEQVIAPRRTGLAFTALGRDAFVHFDVDPNRPDAAQVAQTMARLRGDNIPAFGPPSVVGNHKHHGHKRSTRRGGGGGEGGEQRASVVDLEDRVRSEMRQTQGDRTRWTLPPTLWTEGIIEDTAFVRNQPLVGDPPVHTMARQDRRAVMARLVAHGHDDARHARPLLGNQHPVVNEFRHAAAARADVARQRILPDAFLPPPPPHELRTVVLAEIGPPTRKPLLPPGATGKAIAERTPQDFFPIQQS